MLDRDKWHLIGPGKNDIELPSDVTLIVKQVDQTGVMLTVDRSAVSLSMVNPQSIFEMKEGATREHWLALLKQSKEKRLRYGIDRWGGWYVAKDRQKVPIEPKYPSGIERLKLYESGNALGYKQTQNSVAYQISSNCVGIVKDLKLMLSNHNYLLVMLRNELDKRVAHCVENDIPASTFQDAAKEIIEKTIVNLREGIVKEAGHTVPSELAVFGRDKWHFVSPGEKDIRLPPTVSLIVDRSNSKVKIFLAVGKSSISLSMVNPQSVLQMEKSATKKQWLALLNQSKEDRLQYGKDHWHSWRVAKGKEEIPIEPTNPSGIQGLMSVKAPGLTYQKIYKKVDYNIYLYCGDMSQCLRQMLSRHDLRLIAMRNSLDRHLEDCVRKGIAVDAFREGARKIMKAKIAEIQDGVAGEADPALSTEKADDGGAGAGVELDGPPSAKRVCLNMGHSTFEALAGAVSKPSDLKVYEDALMGVALTTPLLTAFMSEFSSKDVALP